MATIRNDKREIKLRFFLYNYDRKSLAMIFKFLGSGLSIKFNETLEIEWEI